jgi:glycosyltransferase involved in cell wall biosynthesis
MSGDPAVSVIISTFNRSQLLAASLEGLARQRLDPPHDFELIVVDNNSSDNTAAVVSRFALEMPGRCRYLFEPRQGPSHGRNAGIRVARAPIVAFTDDDNVVDPDWIATIISVLDRHPEAQAVGGRVLPEWSAPAPAWLNARHWAPLAILDYGDRLFHTNSADPRCLLTANLAIRRKVFAEIGEFSPHFPRCQDHELLIRFWRAGASALYAPELVVRAPIPRERLTRQYHRAWHKAHGAFTARMRLQEIFDRQGRLLEAPVEAPRLYGTPGFVYRAFCRHVWQWIGGVLRFDRAAAADHANNVLYFAAYIGENARRWLREPRGSIQDLVAFLHAHVARRLKSPAISIRRVVLVHCLVVTIVGASLYDIRTGREHWPVSPYPMFSEVERIPALDAIRLFGVTDEPTPREIPLNDSNLIAPFDQARLSNALRLTYNDLSRRTLVTDMLSDCLFRYERRRISGEHDGPALQAVRLYNLHWTLDPRAANVDTPDSRRLLTQVDRRAETASGFK